MDDKLKIIFEYLDKIFMTANKIEERLIYMYGKNFNIPYVSKYQTNIEIVRIYCNRMKKIIKITELPFNSNNFLKFLNCNNEIIKNTNNLKEQLFYAYGENLNIPYVNDQYTDIKMINDISNKIGIFIGENCDI